MKRITVYLNEKQHRELKLFCAQIGLSMSFFITLAIKEKIHLDLKKNNVSLGYGFIQSERLANLGKEYKAQKNHEKDKG